MKPSIGNARAQKKREKERKQTNQKKKKNRRKAGGAGAAAAAARVTWLDDVSVGGRPANRTAPSEAASADSVRICGKRRSVESAPLRSVKCVTVDRLRRRLRRLRRLLLLLHHRTVSTVGFFFLVRFDAIDAVLSRWVLRRSLSAALKKEASWLVAGSDCVARSVVVGFFQFRFLNFFLLLFRPLELGHRAAFGMLRDGRFCLIFLVSSSSITCVFFVLHKFGVGASFATGKRNPTEKGCREWFWLALSAPSVATDWPIRVLSGECGLFRLIYFFFGVCVCVCVCVCASSTRLVFFLLL